MTSLHDTLGIATGATINPLGKSFESLMDDIAATGCQAIRNSAGWAQCEPTLGGGYDWKAPDALIAGCEKRGLELVLEAGSRGDGKLYSSGLPAHYVKWWAALAQRYEGRILATAPQNEIEHVKVDPHPTALNYTTLIQKPGYEAIKKVAPSMTVLTSGLGGEKNDGDIGTSADFLVACYDDGIAGHFDGLAFHEYTHPLTPSESMAQMHRGFWLHHLCRVAMKANGEQAKLSWITEYGVQTGDTREPITEAKQASTLTEAVKMHRAHPWAGPFFWFTYQDKVPNVPPVDYGDTMGLVRLDGSAKPALKAFQAALVK